MEQHREDRLIARVESGAERRADRSRDGWEILPAIREAADCDRQLFGESRLGQHPVGPGDDRGHGQNGIGER